MKKEAVEKLYNSITNVRDEYIEEFIDAAQETKGKASRLKSRPVYILVAAILAVLLLGAGASALLYSDNIQGWFGRYWEVLTGESMSDEQTAVIDSLSQKIGLSQTVGGVTVTVDSATVGDDKFFLLLRVDGVQAAKGQKYQFEKYNMDVIPQAETMLAHGSGYLGTDSSGALLILLDCDYAVGANTAADVPLKVSLQLYNLAKRSIRTDKLKLLCKGEWSFDFTLVYSQSQQIILLEDTQVVVTDFAKDITATMAFSDIELTNIGLRFRSADPEASSLDPDVVCVVLKNGVTVRCEQGIGVPTTDEAIWKFSYHWTVPINIDEVDHLKIGETEIPVS